MAYSRAKIVDYSALPRYISYSPAPRDPSELSELQKLSERLNDACYNGQVEAVQSLLVERDALAPRARKKVDVPLDSAILAGQVGIIKLLLDKGAQITEMSAMYASREDKPNVLEIFKTFCKAGWPIKSTIDEEGTKLAMESVMRNPNGYELLEWFLSNGAPANGPRQNHGSPIRAAQSQAQAELLISYGATLPNTSCLHSATRVPEEDWALQIMTFYLDHDVDIDEIEWKGRNDKRRLSRSRREVRDDGTALHVAVRNGSLARVKLLVDRGADIEIKTLRNGRTARDIAQVLERQEIMEYLEDSMRDRGILFQRQQPER